ncbi:glycosyltransferase family 4 protein [Methylobacterium frigidaeris]|uniref:D-inositol-3-phosphate glycosyltransferase n=1 Tax=Methylobacterium frigidaeris TaxID=2038277 RepID=A0AA37M6Y5_9HYPH|nr:glycosyltransferase family 4 protein [Methylobacterium frigidaeris]GJD64269.1 D-inositol-3-phosphate glycosyltransferase [Methylobacterium frigidaeris]
MIDRVVVLSDDAVESGGAAGIALRSVRLLAGRDIPVTILNGSAEPDGAERWRALPRVELHSLGGLSLMQGGRGAAAARGVFSLPALRFVAEWIRANDTPGTVYHLHNWHKVLSPSVFRPLGSVAERLVMTAHDYFLVCPNGGQFDFQAGTSCDRVPLSGACLTTQCDRRHYGHKLWRVARHAVRQGMIDLARSPATVLAVHDGMVPLLVRGGVAHDRVAVLRNPVVPWRTTRVEAERNGDVLFVGRLERDKGVDVVAAAACKAGLPLTIIGDGPLRDELAQIHPGARILGWRSPEEIAGLVGTVRFAVVPTRWRETFGLVTLEAIASGLPVLVSRHALIAREAEALGCVQVCDPYDPVALAAAMSRLARDDDAVRRMSEAGFARSAILAPRPEAWCDQLVGLYERVLARSQEAHQDRPRAAPRPAARPGQERANLPG